MRKETLQNLKNSRSLLLFGYGSTVVFYAASMFAMFLSLRHALLFVGLTTIYYFTVVRFLQGRFSRAFALSGLEYGTSQKLKEAETFDRNAKMNDAVKQRKLLSLDNVSCGLGISGKTQTGATVNACELTASYRTKDGKSAFLSGIWEEVRREQAEFNIASESTGDRAFYMIHHTLLPAVSLPNDAEQFFPNSNSRIDYDFFAVNESDERQRSDFVKKFERFIKRAGVHCAIREDENGTCAFLSGKQLLCDVPVRDSLKEEYYAFDRLSELELLG